jgi:hypothetical protein
VRAENPIHGCEQQSCGAGDTAVMITGHVPAVRGTRPICGGSCASTRSTTISTGRTAPCTLPAPLKPLAEPVNLDQHRVRKQAHVGGLINEYRLVA